MTSIGRVGAIFLIFALSATLGAACSDDDATPSDSGADSALLDGSHPTDSDQDAPAEDAATDDAEADDAEADDAEADDAEADDAEAEDSQAEDSTVDIGGVAQQCIDAGGTVTTALCCLAADAFPNLCAIGACGCAPSYSHTIEICSCGDGKCWNGSDCVSE